MVVNGLEPTEDRARVILFSKPYYIFRLQLTVRKNETRIGKLEDCKNRVVGTLGNTAASRMMEKQGIPFKGYADPVGAYRDLELGRIDAVLMDIPAEMFYARDNPRLKPAGEPFAPGAYIIGMRKGDDALKAEVDAGIDKMIRDGSLERILRKWRLWDDEQARFQASIKTVVAEGQQKPEEPAYEITGATFNWGEALLRLTRAAVVTVLLSLGAMLIAVTLGLALALGQSRGPAVVRWLSTIYVEFFRGTPVLVQLLFLYFGLPVLGLAMPGWLTALVGLGLNYAAYESQVYRAALEAIPKGQYEAAYSLGMSPAARVPAHHPAAGFANRAAADDERLRLTLQRYFGRVRNLGLGVGDRLPRTCERLGRVHALGRNRVGLLPSDESAARAPRAEA